MTYFQQRATIMGLGHFGGGVAVARWLAQQGARVTITDAAAEESMAESMAELRDVPIAACRFAGHHQDDFRHADLIVVNPAVKPSSEWLAIAQRSGARLCTELELFLEHCPAPVVGVTGSNGKSTTAAMIAAILQAAGKPTFLGGNIGGSLLPQLPAITPDAAVVLEISSFQLWHFSPAVRMPHVAVVTGCSPNHLDWHADYGEYVRTKQRLIAEQQPNDYAVLNTFDAEVRQWTTVARGRQVSLPALADLPPLRVPGEHNRINAACAAAAAIAAGCTWDDCRRGLTDFTALPQRLELVATIDDRLFYNDSTATTPESTIAALRAIDRPVWLLAGGKSKGFDFQPMLVEVVARTKGAAFFGSAGEELRAGAATASPPFPCIAAETLENALAWCWQRSRPGDAILLSPACASTDQFRNFRHRGECFEALVRGLDR